MKKRVGTKNATKRRPVVKKEKAIKKLQRGSMMLRTFTCPQELLKDANGIIEMVRERSGYNANRSRLIQALFGLAVESANELDAAVIIDLGTFSRELRRAIVKKAAK